MILPKGSAAAVLLASSASVFTPSPLGHDLAPVSPSQRLIDRKDSAEGDEGTWPVLATVVNTHTDEVVILDDDSPSAARWSSLLRDRVVGAAVEMAPPLLAMLRQLARRYPGSRVELVSGFRSPKLNETLRKKGHRVASHSQHSLGHAVDFRLVGLTPREMRSEVRGLGWAGGVGQYDKPTDRFIHIDVGRKRDWHERLARAPPAELAVRTCKRRARPGIATGAGSSGRRRDRRSPRGSGRCR